MRQFHSKSLQGNANWSNEETLEVIGHDRESSQQDLFDSIEQGNYPRWRMCVQVMPERDADAYRINPFDLTKIWPHTDYPLIEVGILELNRNPENYFAEVEQSAFTPANVVPGIGFSPNRMLQGRLFSHGDAQRYRLGVNHHWIPSRRRHARGWQSRRHAELRPEPLRQLRTGQQCKRAAAGAKRRG